VIKNPISIYRSSVNIRLPYALGYNYILITKIRKTTVPMDIVLLLSNIHDLPQAENCMLPVMIMMIIIYLLTAIG
jgi:hypothetical protein